MFAHFATPQGNQNRRFFNCSPLSRGEPLVAAWLSLLSCWQGVWICIQEYDSIRSQFDSKDFQRIQIITPEGWIKLVFWRKRVAFAIASWNVNLFSAQALRQNATQAAAQAKRWVYRRIPCWEYFLRLKFVTQFNLVRVKSRIFIYLHISSQFCSWQVLKHNNSSQQMCLAQNRASQPQNRAESSKLTRQHCD